MCNDFEELISNLKICKGLKYIPPSKPQENGNVEKFFFRIENTFIYFIITSERIKKTHGKEEKSMMWFFNVDVSKKDLSGFLNSELMQHASLNYDPWKFFWHFNNEDQIDFELGLSLLPIEVQELILFNLDILEI